MMDTSLRFRVAEFSGSLDLTIRVPYFYERGQPSDWDWREFFLNGVKWKGRTIPKLPILQPEKVTTTPLEIRLTEEYVVRARRRDDDRRPARVPRRLPPAQKAVGDKPIYRGTAWIDKETFAAPAARVDPAQPEGRHALERPDGVLPRVPARTASCLPARDQGPAGVLDRGTHDRHRAVRRDERRAGRPRDFAKRRTDALESKSQMVRDTDQGLRYLVPDAEHPGERVVEQKLTRRSLFGSPASSTRPARTIRSRSSASSTSTSTCSGRTSSSRCSSPACCSSGTTPTRRSSGRTSTSGSDVFGVAIPFVETSYRDGEEVVSEKIKHLPEFFQVNVGHPIGPYFKASLGLFTQWDNYQRDEDTGPNFVTPVDTLTNGALLRLNWNEGGYNIAGKISYNDRRKWAPWGDPLTSGYDPSQKDYWKFSLEAQKAFFFENFKKLFVKVSYLDGTDLDRFSQWDFGPYGGTEMRGFPSGSLRADRAVVNNLSYGINIENVVRFEVLYDQAWVKNALQGLDYTYFSGAGIATAFNGPWENTRIRGEVGVPIVRHGISGFTISAQLLKLF
jgi:hypothetical protein